MKRNKKQQYNYTIKVVENGYLIEGKRDRTLLRVESLFLSPRQVLETLKEEFDIYMTFGSDMEDYLVDKCGCERI